ncbi:hypothetical protein ACNOHN_13935 [Bacteroides zhangwenhongii]|uniref:hypothetical protein n=1 Tax=Bacteroides zhangwenhongii TaxID=2650157 RepID=UPI003AAD9CFC
MSQFIRINHFSRKFRGDVWGKTWAHFFQGRRKYWKNASLLYLKQRSAFFGSSTLASG